MDQRFETTSELERLHRVVVIGSGFGGLWATKALEEGSGAGHGYR